MNKGLFFGAGLVIGLAMMNICSSSKELLITRNNAVGNNRSDLEINVVAITYPENGYVPNEETAIAIAEAVIIPIYGKRRMKSERPYKAKLKNNEVWHVWGSIPYKWLGVLGGSIEVEISKKDGRILNVYYSK